MKVSVIIPVYNHEKYLGPRIESILNQTFKDYELIILDDASTDNSRDIIKKYLKNHPDLKTSYNSNNSGSPFKQWNKGVSMAKGEFIWIAESDDFADPYFLEKTFAKIQRSEIIGMVWCDSWIFDEEKGIKYKFSDKKKVHTNCVKPLTSQSFIKNPIPNVSGVLFRKSAYLTAGGSDISMKFCGDWMLYYRIHLFYKILYLPEPLSTFRLHVDSQYHKYYNSNIFIKEILQVYKKILEDNKYSVILMLKIIISLVPRLFLRLLHLLKFPPIFMPKIPRQPREVEYVC